MKDILLRTIVQKLWREKKGCRNQCSAILRREKKSDGHYARAGGGKVLVEEHFTIGFPRLKIY